MKKCSLLLIIPFLLVGCSDYFDRKSDDSSIPASRFFGDEGAFLSALTDVYTQLRSDNLFGGTLTLTMMDFLSGELQPLGDLGKAASQHDFADKTLQRQLDSMVSAAYRAVASCNLIIQEAEHTDVVFFNSSQKNMILGECHALRAALQFDLLRLFGPSPQDDGSFSGMPYMTVFGQKDVPLLTKAQLLQAMQADLAKAEQLLATTDPILQPTNPTTVVVGRVDRRLRTLQMNYFAVKALQARLALWSGDYEHARACADKVFAHQRDVADRYQLFHYVAPGKYASDYEFSREFIFGISTLPKGFPQLSDSLQKAGLKVTDRLRTIYPQASDIRYRAWFKASADGYTLTKFGSETLLSGYIYSQTGGETGLPAAIPYIKLGEVALIAAESSAHLGRLEEAADYLKTLQSNKNVDEAAQLQAGGGLTKEALLQLIYTEYERELLGEGQLYYLYKRLGKVGSPRLPR